MPKVTLLPHVRRSMVLVGWGAGLSVAMVSLFAAIGAASGSDPVMIPAVAGACLVYSLALPCASMVFARTGDMRAWTRLALPSLAGIVLGTVGLTLVAATAATGRVLQSLIVAGTVAFAYGTFVGIFAGRLKSPMAGGILASLGLVAAISVPFWSGDLFRTGAGVRFGTWIIGSSPYLATALPWVAPIDGWAFDPRTSNVLYDVWVGTDVPIAYPAWSSCAIGFSLFGGVLLVLSAAPGIIAKWRASRH